MSAVGEHLLERAPAELLDELIEAHADTVRILEQLEPDLRREAHADYLHGLQRVGRATLARLTDNRLAPPQRR